MYYNGGYSARHCYLMILGILIINASMQVGFVYAIRVRSPLPPILFFTAPDTLDGPHDSAGIPQRRAVWRTRRAVLWRLKLHHDRPRPHVRPPPAVAAALPCLALPCLTSLTPGPRSPQYYEIHKHRAVIGISVTFMFVDLLGGVFSDLSLAFKPKFDVIASVTYSVVIVRARAPFSPARLV